MPWLLKKTLAVLGFILLGIGVTVYQVPMVALRAAFHMTTTTAPHYDWLMAATTAVAGAIEIGLLLWLYRWRLRRANPLHIGPARLSVGRIGLVVAMYALIITANALIMRVGVPQNQQTINELEHLWPWTVFVMVLLIGPLAEELVFRGLFMTLFWTKDNVFNTTGAVSCSALAFGLLHEPHLSWFLVIYTVMGLALGFTYRRTRDLRWSLALHVIINLPGALVAIH
ncbi:CPBP family intramembrane glutamic endopeptidase [Lacticaseibacillus yichunensis]|uniref:CPBP family intramembrane glutamic endopeptidase n=1 Tax=Lacticaseibacillus yichunensis TaxID=2486015 RepID=A0ABW4CQ37_9LACO|nr:type II CAAX endopeptidase family protein [Lacticaseibacillus yichunensis]